MNVLADFRALCRVVIADPWGWTHFQLLTLSKAVLPHARNNDFRKLTTTALFGVWMLKTLGIGPAVTAETYAAITAVCFLVLGQQWELEKFRFGPFEVHTPSDDDE